MEEDTGPVVSQESIEKGRSRLGLGLAMLLLTVVVVLLFTGNDDEPTAIGGPPTSVDDALTEPISTVMTLATGADTVAKAEAAAGVDTAAQPARGELRAATRQRMTRSCGLRLAFGVGGDRAGAVDEHDRCLDTVDDDLGRECVHSARARFLAVDDDQLRIACDVAVDVALPASRR